MGLGELTKLPQIAKLSPSVIRILGCNPGLKTLQGTNTYLVGTGRGRLLIDTSEDGKPEYVSWVKKILGQESASLSDIVVTHWHHDHLGGVPQLLSAVSGSAKPTVRKFPLDGETFEYDVSSIKDGEEIAVEGATLRAVHTPGHTADHVVLWESDTRTLFSGDCILGETTAVFEDYVSYISSLRKILGLEPKVIYPGHGPVINDPCERILMYIKHREQREMQYLEVLNKQRDYVGVEFITRAVYVGLDDAMIPAAMENVTCQLKKLKSENRVLQDGDEDRWKVRK